MGELSIEELKRITSINSQTISEKQSELSTILENQKKQMQIINSKKKNDDLDYSFVSVQEEIFNDEYIDVSVYFNMLINYIENNELCEEDLYSLLPDRNTSKFQKTINTILCYLLREVKIYTDLSYECEDDLSLDINKYMKAIKMIISYRDNNKNIVKNEAEKQKAIIICLRSSNGADSLLLKDIKAFGHESIYFDGILKLLEELEEGNLKHEKIYSSSTGLNNCSVLRDTNLYIRILFSKLGNNIYLIRGIFKKNTTELKKGLLATYNIGNTVAESEEEKIKELIANGDEQFLQLAQSDYEKLKAKLYELGKGEIDDEQIRDDIIPTRSKK